MQIQIGMAQDENGICSVAIKAGSEEGAIPVEMAIDVAEQMQLNNVVATICTILYPFFIKELEFNPVRALAVQRHLYNHVMDELGVKPDKEK